MAWYANGTHNNTTCANSTLLINAQLVQKPVLNTCIHIVSDVSPWPWPWSLRPKSKSLALALALALWPKSLALVLALRVVLGLGLDP